VTIFGDRAFKEELSKSEAYWYHTGVLIRKKKYGYREIYQGCSC
jgi:hypothetical protein